MANVDNPNGARPIKHLTGAPYNGQCNEYYIPSTDGTAVYIGDFVMLAGSAAADGTPTVTAATDGTVTQIVGSVVGFRPDPTNLTLNYRPASTNRYVLVADDPDLIFEMQEDSTGGALAATNTGQNVDIYGQANGSTITGRSGMEIDSSTAATTNTLSLRLLRAVKAEDNAIGTNCRWEVKINLHAYRVTTGV